MCAVIALQAVAVIQGGSPEWHGIKAIFVDFLRQKAG
jgi:hypothetical protein